MADELRAYKCRADRRLGKQQRGAGAAMSAVDEAVLLDKLLSDHQLLYIHLSINKSKIPKPQISEALSE